MAKKIKQFRYYNETDERNNPIANGENLLDKYRTGSVFNGVFPISQLGVQGPPNTKFYLNGSVYPIVIGASGIYDLEIKNGATITEMSFDPKSMANIRDNGGAYLIVDVLYEGDE